LPGKHPALDGHVDTFKPLRVQKAAGIPNNQATIDISSWHRVPTAGWNCLGAVAHQLSALDDRLYERVRLPLLKSLVRIELRVGILEADDQADRNAIVR